jgi:hypothetical protein
MNAMLLLIAATLGVDFTYELNTTGQVEYTMTIESELVPQLVQGKGVRSVIPKAALGGRVLRLRVEKTNVAGLINTVNDQPLNNAVSQGVRQSTSGGYEYVVQISPVQIELFKSGRPIVVAIDPALDSASELIIISGTERLASFESVRNLNRNGGTVADLNNPRNGSPTLADPATRNVGDNQVRPAQFSQQAGINRTISIPPNALENSPTQPRPLPQQNLGNSSRRDPTTPLSNLPNFAKNGPLNNQLSNPLNNGAFNNGVPNNGVLNRGAPNNGALNNGVPNNGAFNNLAPNNGGVNNGPLRNAGQVNNASQDFLNNNRNTVPNGQLPNNGQFPNPNIPGVGRPNVGPLSSAPFNGGQVNPNPLGGNAGNNQVGNGNIGPIGSNLQTQGPFYNAFPQNNQSGGLNNQKAGPLNTGRADAGGWAPAGTNGQFPNGGNGFPDNRVANQGQLNPALANPNGQNPNGQNPNQQNFQDPNQPFNNPAFANSPFVPGPNSGVYNSGLNNSTVNNPGPNTRMTPNGPWQNPNAVQQDPYSPKDAQFLAALNSLATKIDLIDKKANGQVAVTPGVGTPDANFVMLQEMKKIADSIKVVQNPALTNQSLTPTSVQKSPLSGKNDTEKRNVWGGSMSFLLLAFCLSLAGNGFLVWVAWDYFERYQQLSDDLRNSRND